MRPLFRTRRRVVFVGLIVGYVATMLFGGLADRLLLHPTRHPIGAGTAQRVLILDGGGRVVEAWVDRSPGASRGA